LGTTYRDEGVSRTKALVASLPLLQAAGGVGWWQQRWLTKTEWEYAREVAIQGAIPLATTRHNLMSIRLDGRAVFEAVHLDQCDYRHAMTFGNAVEQIALLH
jgi:hypothetical protein